MFADAYRRGHQRIVAFMDGRDPHVTVPATPDWTALDVLRHLAGNAADLSVGNMDGFASDAWTEAQVLDRADLSIDEVLAEWAGTIDRAASVLDDIGSLGLGDAIPSAIGSVPPSVIPPMAMSDILHHEFDVRNAYGNAEGRDLMDLHFAAAGSARSLRGPFTASGLDTIRIESTDSGMGWDIGYGTPVAFVRASSFELFRGIGGRRTRPEMRAMGWDGDPEPFLDHMVVSHLRMRDTSLRE